MPITTAADDQQRLTAQTVHRQNRDHGKDDVGDADDDGLQQGRIGGCAQILEHQRRVVEHRVDADELLEHREHDAGHDDQLPKANRPARNAPAPPARL
jgi:hypothetical protein